MTRDDLAAACAKRGYPLTSATIANIETGRRDPADRRRRREVSVDELVMLADVLNVAPVLLVFPVGHADEHGRNLSEFVNGADVDTWEAAQWFGGHGDHPIGSVDAAAAGRTDRGAMQLFEDYHDSLRELWKARANVKVLQGRVARGENGDTAETLAIAEQGMRQLENVIRQLRMVMRQRGLNPPSLPEKDASLDGR